MSWTDIATMTMRQVMVEFGIDDDSDIEDLQREKQVQALLRVAADYGLSPQAFAKLGETKIAELCGKFYRIPFLTEKVKPLLAEPEFESNV